MQIATSMGMGRAKSRVGIWQFGVLVLMVVALRSVDVYANDEESDFVLAEHFINRFQTIALWVNHSWGRGHQGGTLDLIDGLNHLNYRGRIVISEPNVYQPSIQRMAPELLRNSHYQFVPEDRLFNDPGLKNVPIFTGAGEIPFASGILQMTLQPTWWTDPRVITFWLPSFEARYNLDHLIGHSTFVATQSPKEILDYTARYKPYLLTAVDSLLKNPKLPWSVAYGLGVHGESILARIIVTLRKMKDDFLKARLSDTPTIALVSQLNTTEWNTVRELVASYSAELKIQTTLEVFSPAEYDALASDSDQNTVRVIKFGEVPQKLYKGLLQHSTLPATVAGTGALNYVRFLGVPHLLTRTTAHLTQDNLSSNQNFLERSDEDYSRRDKAISISGLAYMALVNDSGLATSTYFITDYINAALNPNSTYSKVLRAARRNYVKNLQLVAALALAEKTYPQKNCLSQLKEVSAKLL